jgi:transketolase
MTSQRDVFIGELFKLAKKDKDVYLITVDMGAPSLDAWRTQLPEQLIYAGISEQHAINFAAGLSSKGKKVYIYFMASWVARCFEQIRYSCAIGDNPVTILGNGVGLGYAPAGPAHETNDDIAYTRSLLGIEIYSPSNNRKVKELVTLTYSQKRRLRYIRLERKHSAEIENYYQNKSIMESNGIELIGKGSDHNIAIVSYGYMLGRSLEVCKKLNSVGVSTELYDMWKTKPVDKTFVKNNLCKYNYIITIEEQTLSGGFGSILCEALADLNVQKPLLRLGLKDMYMLENGSRDYLIDKSGLSVNEIYKKIISFTKD